MWKSPRLWSGSALTWLCRRGQVASEKHPPGGMTLQKTHADSSQEPPHRAPPRVEVHTFSFLLFSVARLKPSACRGRTQLQTSPPASISSSGGADIILEELETEPVCSPLPVFTRPLRSARCCNSRPDPRSWPPFPETTPAVGLVPAAAPPPAEPRGHSRKRSPHMLVFYSLQGEGVGGWP